MTRKAAWFSSGVASSVAAKKTTSALVTLSLKRKF